MNRLIKERSVLRRTFTIYCRELEGHFVPPVAPSEFLTTGFKKVSGVVDKLTKLDTAIVDDMLNRDCEEHALEEEYSSIDTYTEKWYMVESRYDNIMKEYFNTDKSRDFHSSTSNDTYNAPTKPSVIMNPQQPKRQYNLPKIELKKFDGSLKNWLPFWGQFRKIDADKNIEDDDKYQYLLQCMEPGTHVKSIVESFPPSGPGYHNALEQLKSRFAREDILILTYVRELLNVALSHAKGHTMSLTLMYDEINSQIRSLETLGVSKDRYSAFVYPMIESSLPEDILKTWERSRNSFGESSLDTELTNLLNFLKREVESDQRIQLAKTSFSDISKEITTNRHATAECLTTTVGKPQKENTKLCIFCDKDSHCSLECYKGSKMSLQQRKDLLKKKKACTLCLKPGHHIKICKAFIKCGVCAKRHSMLLCPANRDDKSVFTDTPSNTETSTNFSQSTAVTLLQTILINITNGNKQITIRALIDSGSQRTYIKKSVAESVGLRPTGVEVLSQCLFGGVQIKTDEYPVYEFSVQSVDKTFSINLLALAQECICGEVPRLRLSDKNVSYLLDKYNVTLTDRGNDNPEIGLLIGADFIGSLLTREFIKFNNELVAIKTMLGWTLQGKKVQTYSCNMVNSLFCSTGTDLSNLWSIELLGVNDPAETKSKSQNEAEIMMAFEESIKVNTEGRYEVQLPWRYGKNELLSNHDLAVRRLKSMTKNILKINKFNAYGDVFNDWLELGIIERVPETEINLNKAVHYLPHKAVLKESSLTTKIRPVFDASAKDANGRSLNGCLDKGLNFLDRLPNLLIGFRKGAIGVSADIAKAFLQISLSDHDRDFLRFLWWKDDSLKDMHVFRHCRVVFGLTCSPFLLSATIMHHLSEITGDLKKTAKHLMKTFYVDNCVTSLNSETDMRDFILQAKKILALGKFDLRQWVTSPLNINETGETIISVLGLMWDTIQDELSCNVTAFSSVCTKITKRHILSLTQKVFDPIGFTCPVTLIPKVLLQKCWQQKLDWDTEVPDTMSSIFIQWYEKLPHLKFCKIQRRLTDCIYDNCEISLHMFCDASKDAYAACVFLRSSLEQRVTVRLLAAKSRVAPQGMKQLTIPRLELMAALIGSRLLNEARKGLENDNINIYCWTDSAVVLYWIWKELPWNTFVGNRVKEIRMHCPSKRWFHIAGIYNWADLASRGCDAYTLLSCRWWEGPLWLKDEPEKWPTSNIAMNEQDANAEIELAKDVLCVNICTEDFIKIFDRFSRYISIVRIIAWLLRFMYNARRNNRMTRMKGVLTYTEIETAEKIIIKLIQKEYDADIKRKNLNIFLDSDGILRLQTKIILSDEPEAMKYPYILPSRHTVVRRLVEQKHRELQHAGPNIMITEIRKKFWIVGIRRLVKSVIFQCTRCKRFSAKSLEVPVAPLPITRIVSSAPFEVTGIDLTGPLFLRCGCKVWVVLFTCAVYRAVHLELAKTLTTEGFLMAFRRFVARRGRISVVYSDNGTNFVGAENLLSSLKWDEIQAQTQATISRIKWKFNAPTASWWGGFWERLIGLLKQLLRRVLGKSRLNYTELETLLCDCEAVLNNRPLTYVADDSGTTLEPLTPACFLTPLSQKDMTADLDYIDEHVNNEYRLKYIQKLRSDFRQRFKKEYLTALVQPRSRKSKYVLKVGDVVLMETEDKRLNWPMAVVEELYPGVDGVVRSAKIKTLSGHRIRPLQRLYLLEAGSSTDNLHRSVRTDERSDAS